MKDNDNQRRDDNNERLRQHQLMRINATKERQDEERMRRLRKKREGQGKEEH